MKTNILKYYQEKINKMDFFIKLKKEFYYQITPLLKKWQLLSKREKNLLTMLSIVFLMYLIINIFLGVINFAEEVKIKNNNLKIMLLKANQLNKEYDNISQFNPNKFSEVTTDKIKDDMIQILDIKEPFLSLEENILIIKGEKIKFEKIIQLLGQFRNSYGIFPVKLVLTKEEPDVVSFNISFMVK